MGKASSSKKVARAARAAGRPGSKRSYGWPLAIGAVVVVGVVLIVASFGGGEEEVPPRLGDHWHAAYGIYDCDAYEASLVDVGEDVGGIHTHAEGLMHIHPFSSRYFGEGANIGAFMDQTGVELSDTSITTRGMDRENGDDCGDEPGMLQLLIWDSPSDETPTIRTEDLRAYAPDDGTVWTLAFVPEGTDVPKPPAVANLQDPTALEEGRQPVVPPSTTAPGDDTPPTTAATTIPPDDSNTTTTAP